MRGLGTLINAGLIVLGGIFGLFFGKYIKFGLRDTLISVTGVAVIVLAVGGIMEKTLTVTENGLSSGGSIMMVVSLAVGTVIGELAGIEKALTKFGEWIKNKSGNAEDTSFVSGFVSASCTVSIGAMAIIGAINDGISGDFTLLAVKGILDCIIVCIMTAAMGKGCIFSAVPVAVLQGSVTVAAYFAGDFMPQNAVNGISAVGSVLILCIGLNLIRDKKIPVANMLPSIIIAGIWGAFL